VKLDIVRGRSHGTIPQDTPKFAANFSAYFFLPLQNFFAAAAHDSPADLAGNPQIGTKHVCLAAAHILFR